MFHVATFFPGVAFTIVLDLHVFAWLPEHTTPVVADGTNDSSVMDLTLSTTRYL